jgi:outer membrane lipoprotein-sorting protein
LKQRDIRILKTAEMKFVRDTAGCSLLDNRRSKDIFEPKNRSSQKEICSVNKNGYIMLTGWKTLETQNNSLTINLLDIKT